MKNKYLFLFGFAFVCFLFNANTTFAQTASGKIIYSFMEDGKGKVKPYSMNGVSFMSGKLYARLETDDKNSIFNGMTGVCQNWVVPVGEDNAFSHGVCVLADKDGDTFVTSSTSMQKDETSIVHTKGGTGKFANLDGKGKGFGNGPADTGKEKDCCMNKWTLKYKL